MWFVVNAHEAAQIYSVWKQSHLHPGVLRHEKTLPLERLSLIRVVPIQDENFQRTLGVLSRKRRYLSPVAKSFYHKLLSYFKSMELNEL